MAITDRLGATVSATEAPSSSTPNAGLALKTAVRVATTGANIALSGLQTLDGVALNAGDRVLVKDQADQTTNGIYNAAPGDWAAASDFANNSQLAAGCQVWVNFGTVNGQTSWVLNDTDPVVLGTTALTFRSTLSANQLALSPATPYLPVINPSSGNLQASGLTTKHQLVWTDANTVFSADDLTLMSSDPSALNSITVTGTPAAGTVTLTYSFGAQTVPITVNVQAGWTTTQVAAAIVAAIQANATLFNAPSATNLLGGGYANGTLIGYITNVANVVDYNTNATLGGTVSYSVAGADVTLTFGSGQDAQGTNYSLSLQLDGNPALQLVRNPGLAPPANSFLGGIEWLSSDSAAPTAMNTLYGYINLEVTSPTAGSRSGRLYISGLVESGGVIVNGGVWVGAGFYTVNQSDKGADTINAGQVWIASEGFIQRSGTALQMVAASTDSIQIAPGSASGMVQVAQAGVNVVLQIQSDATHFPLVELTNTANNWQLYIPLSGSDLRFYDGADDRLILKNGGGVLVNASSFGLEGNIAAPAWTTLGVRYANVAGTLTDTTSSGTVAAAYTSVHGGNTIAASSATTFTNYYGHYFKAEAAGTHVTLTNGWALGADSAKINGPLSLGVAGVTAASIVLANATSGSITLSPPAGALGAAVLTLPAVTDTLAALAATQTLTNKTITSSTDVLGGVTMQLGSDAAGDIYYRSSGGILTRLPIGAANNPLIVSGGLPAWGPIALGSSASVSGTLGVANGGTGCTSAPARSNTAVASPGGTTSTSGVMMGLAASIKPLTSGNVLIIVIAGTAISGGALAIAQIRYGTGTANGPLIGNVSTAGNLALSSYLTGLTVGTTYWIDLAQYTTNASDAASFSAVNVIVIEE